VNMTDDERQALREWIDADGRDKIATALGVSSDSVARWAAGSSPYGAALIALRKALKARARSAT